jgi:hypothetical protein
LDTFTDTQSEINKEFREGIAEGNGRWKYALGISVGVSSAVSCFVVILGFLLKFGAFPVSMYPEAEAAEFPEGKPILNIMDAAELRDIATPVEEVEEEESDIIFDVEYEEVIEGNADRAHAGGTTSR